MKELIIKLGRKLVIPTCGLALAYHVFYHYISNIPYIFIINWIVLLSAIFVFISWFVKYIYGSKNKNSKHKSSDSIVIRKLYLQSQAIVTITFCCYSAIYLIFFLDRKSILFSYLFLLLLGLFLGYKLAVKASYYKKKQ